MPLLGSKEDERVECKTGSSEFFLTRAKCAFLVSKPRKNTKMTTQVTRYRIPLEVRNHFHIVLGEEAVSLGNSKLQLLLIRCSR